MCDHLQRMNNSLTEAYSNNVREKDRRIADLENQLFEYTRNSTSEKQWDTSNNTPNKQREQRKASKYNNLRSDSPDSTSRNTPIKPNLIAKDTPIGAKDVKHPGSSSDEVDKSSTFSTIDEKGPKLRLKSRKRNRYTEDSSPESKHPKFGYRGHPDETLGQVLVPETCDPDIVTEDQEWSPKKTEGGEVIYPSEGRLSDSETGGQGTSDSENDTVKEGIKSHYSLRSSLFNGSSEESDCVLKSPRGKGEEKSDCVLKSPREKDEEKRRIENLSDSAKQPYKSNEQTGETEEKRVKSSLDSVKQPYRSHEQTKETEEVLPLDGKGDGYIQSSPIFQVYRKSNQESPDIHHGDTHADSDAESPLLLKVTRSSEDKSKDFTSPAQTRLFDDDDISIVSPDANSSSSFGKFRCLSQGRRRGKLNQSKLSTSFERKKKMETGDDWLVSAKPTMKDSPTLRQSTLSQVFMNVQSKPHPEKPTECDDIQKAIELSLAEVSHNLEKNSREISNVIKAQKENLSPFKRPLTPRKCKNTARKFNSPKGKMRNKRSQSIDCDPDETVPPCTLSVGETEISQGPVTALPPINRSIDPDVQLSVLCDSQSLKSEDLPDIEEPDSEGDKMKDYSDSSLIGNPTDFRIEDLKKSKYPLTSTCTDVDHPPGGEQESQSISCSYKFGGGRRRFIRIPENFSEGPDNHTQNVEGECFVPGHEDSFDRVPGKEQPNFAHVDVVRKQDERRKLPAHKCDECREYFEGLGLPEEEILKRMQTCSRHRAKHAPPGTPKHFWDIGMEDTMDYEEQGYVDTKDHNIGKPRFRRKRQLNKIFKSKKEEEELKQFEEQ
ncbi:uncharacterized protein LOC125645841 isoform X2 [Ostrea edulis]|nr:uncharacterized protein LOC125645841 isoform X2 [Ostrea edulis]